MLIPTADGHLEAIYRPRRRDAERIALLLHPHPLYGGDMHNKVIFRSAKALEEAGCETLRINFRGVGESTGSHDRGRGETDDAANALAFLRHDQSCAHRVTVLGFSFGADIAFRLGARTTEIDHIISIGTPAYTFDAPEAASLAERATFIHGDADDVAPLASLRQRTDGIATKVDLRIIAGADHFFTGKLSELFDCVLSSAR